MTYVGAVPTTGDFKKLDAITASATATYNLRQGGVAVYPQSSSHCLVVLNGILQTGGSSFNIVNDTIVFAEALTSSDVINQILVLGNVNDIGVPSDDTVSTAKIQADAINATKIADDSISDEHLDITAITGQTAITSLADTDKFLVSDASDSGNLKYVEKQYLPKGTLVEVAQSSIAAGSSVAAVEFSNIFSSSYNTYFVRMSKIRFVGDTSLQMRFYSDTGTTEYTGSYYYYVRYGLEVGGSREDNTGNGSDRLYLCATLDYNQPADGGSTGFFYIDNPLANDSFSVNVTGQFGYRNNSDKFNGINFAGKYSGSSARYGFKLYGSSNVEYADITVYGVTP